jgi:hypothetical protein
MASGDTPRLPARLFWDTKQPTGEAEWVRYGTAIIERVLSHGELEDFREVLRFYGCTKVQQVFATSRRISNYARAFGVALYGETALKEAAKCTPMSLLQKLWPY